MVSKMYSKNDLAKLYSGKEIPRDKYYEKEFSELETEIGGFGFYYLEREGGIKKYFAGKKEYLVLDESLYKEAKRYAEDVEAELEKGMFFDLTDKDSFLKQGYDSKKDFDENSFDNLLEGYEENSFLKDTVKVLAPTTVTFTGLWGAKQVNFMGAGDNPELLGFYCLGVLAGSLAGFKMDELRDKGRKLAVKERIGEKYFESVNGKKDSVYIVEDIW